MGSGVRFRFSSDGRFGGSTQLVWESESLSSSLSDLELYYASPLLSSASWSTCMLDIPIATRMTPCTMLSGSLPFSFNFSCSSYLKGHDPL